MWLALIMSLTVGLTDLSVLTVPIVHAEEKVWTQEMVKEFAKEQAEKYGLHKKRFLSVLECENNFEAKGQSGHYYKGKREESYGSAQINLPSHPEVTKEMAENPEFALKFMAEKWIKGKANLWSCYNNLYGTMGME